MKRTLLAILVALFALSAQAAERFGFGQPASAEQIRAADDDLAPWGAVPPGAGTAQAGEELYAAQCASCHGDEGQGGLFEPLVGAQVPATFAQGGKPARTVGNYWPYATTLYDFIYRAMPQATPGSLSADDAYALTAFILYRNGLVDKETNVDGRLLQTLRLPGLQRMRWSGETARMAPRSHNRAHAEAAAATPAAATP